MEEPTQQGIPIAHTFPLSSVPHFWQVSSTWPEFLQCPLNPVETCEPTTETAVTQEHAWPMQEDTHRFCKVA